MSSDVETVLRTALELSPDARADVAAELLASLESPRRVDPESVRREWIEELDLRARRAVSGVEPGKAWVEIRDQTRAGLAH